MRSRILCLAIALLLWLPTLHLFFAPAPDRVAAALLRRQAAHPSDRLRATNPEWALMRRMFEVLALANLALAHPEQRRLLVAGIDAILERTLADEAANGQLYFLLPYARGQRFRDPRGRSLFVDGELALMLAARQTVEPSARWSAEAELRARRIAAQLERAPLTFGESYPDEGWTFCNVVALVALRLHDRRSGQDHRPLVQRWIASARAHLVDERTGLLASSFSYDGRIKDGPEGSTIWLVSALLRQLDPEFAADQYRRAQRELARSLLGFAWAREWPASWPSGEDVDSGPTVPIVGANAGSSGLLVVAAGAFGDEKQLRRLLASLELAGFPIDDASGRRYAAGNELADAVILYGLVQGPLWAQAQLVLVTP